MSATMQIRTLPRTMSGYRGNLVLTLDRETAKDWIARKWATPVEEKTKRRDRTEQEEE